jgi:DNA polymerase elongation subunit (family B)
MMATMDAEDDGDATVATSSGAPHASLPQRAPDQNTASPERYIRVFAYAWASDDDAPDSTLIRAYAIAEDGATVCVRVRCFTPYVYVELRDAAQYDYVLRAIHTAVVETRLVWKRHLYATRGCGDENQPFMFCRCASRRRINDVIWLLRDRFGRGRGMPPPKTEAPDGSDDAVPRVHEKEASAVLQLVALRNISVTGWFKISVGAAIVVPPGASDRVTRCAREYVVRWRSIEPCDKQRDADLTDVIPPPKVLAFDFEVNSELKNALPNDRPDDAIFQISCVTTTGVPGKLKTTLLTLRDANSVAADEGPASERPDGRRGAFAYVATAIGPLAVAT